MVFLPVLFLIFCFIMYQFKNGWTFGPVSFLILIYLGMSVSSVVLYVFWGYADLFDLKIEPVLYFSFVLLFVFSCFFKFTDHNLNCIVIGDVRVVRVLEVFQILTGTAAFVFFIPFAINSLVGDIASNRINLDVTQSALSSYGVVNSFFSLVANLFIVSLVLAFLNLSTLGRGGSRLRAFLLLILSGVYVVYVLAYVGRDGFVYWLMTFIFCYFVFRGFIPRREKKHIIVLCCFVAFPAAIAFILVTISRFGGGEGSIAHSLFYYAGQQIYYFSDRYFVDAPHACGELNFIAFLEIFSFISGEPRPVFDRLEWYQYYLDQDVVPWTFTTFIGSFIGDFGKVGAVIAVLIIGALIRFSLHGVAKSGVIILSNLILFILVSQVVMWGVFYFRHYSAGYYLIAMLLIFFLFKFSGGSGAPFIVYRKS